MHSMQHWPCDTQAHFGIYVHCQQYCLQGELFLKHLVPSLSDALGCEESVKKPRKSKQRQDGSLAKSGMRKVKRLGCVKLGDQEKTGVVKVPQES